LPKLVKGPLVITAGALEKRKENLGKVPDLMGGFITHVLGEEERP